MKLNNKGMSVVEVVLTFAIIMVIVTGLLIIVVNYRNKVSVSVERLTMDTFKNNLTQDIYNDALKKGIKEINEYMETSLDNIANDVKLVLKSNSEYQLLSDSVFDTAFNGALTMVKNDINAGNIKAYSGTDYKNTFARALISEYTNRLGDCLTQTQLNRCINIKYQDNTKAIFGTGKVIANNRDSIEHKYIYYDGLKYTIDDKLPTNIPKDESGNTRPLTDLQRIKLTDDGLLTSDFVVLEDGTKLYIYKINVGVYHIDFREDFGVHIVLSTHDISM